MCVTTTCVTTQHPDSLTITNKWDFVGDTDIDGVSAPSSTSDEQEFALSVRQDKKVSGNLLHVHCLLPKFPTLHYVL